jgi:hypothetical protein
MGLIEIIPGLLLLWSRTRMLGALMALGVLGNVLALNFGFDITVKILSTMLVLASVFVLIPFRKRLWSFFVQNGASEKIEAVELIQKQVLKRALKGFIVALLLIESLFVYMTAEAWNGDNQSKIAHYGSYNMELFSGTSTEFDISTVKRFHIHNSGYLIIESKKGIFQDYKIYLSPRKDKIFFDNSSLEISVKSGKYTTTFSSSSERNNFELITKKIDLERLPLRSDSFHWTVESFMEE